MSKLITLWVFCCLSLAAWSQPVPPTQPGRLMLKLKPQVAAPAALAALAPVLRTLGASSISQKFPRALPPSPEQPGSVDLRRIYELVVPTQLPLGPARARLLATGVVEYVEPRYLRQPLYQPNDPLADSAAAAIGQYYLRLTQAYRAWDFTRGDTSMVIGITDTGMRISHEELVHQVKYNYADPINGRDDDGDGYVDNFRGWDMSNNNNDPTAEVFTAHGSLGSSIASGQADNGKGGAGVGFRCKFLPVQVFSGLSTGVFAGYEGVVYAADHGCRVINMSWGSEGGYSNYEQDVCTYAAINRDAVLVAAGGNSGTNALYYPASYDHVLAVGFTDENDVRAAGSTYSRRLDLVAPGRNIWGVYGDVANPYAGPTDADYWHDSGSSFAAPQVAGAAALVRVRFPQFTAQQVQAQLRRTADTSIYNLPANGQYLGLLGRGRLNVARAVAANNQQEARVTAATFLPAGAVGYSLGDTMQVAITVQNMLQPISNLRITLTSLSPYLVVRQGDFVVGSLATLGQTTNAQRPFRLVVPTGPAIPVNTVATLRYHLAADNGYQSEQYVEVMLNPGFAQLNAGDLTLSLTRRGNIGYDNASGTGGLGVNYLSYKQVLAEGGLLLATSPTRVSDRLRTVAPLSRQSFFEVGTLQRLLPGPRANQQVNSVFQDSLPGTPARSVGVRVQQQGESWASPTVRRGTVLLTYTLRNLTADTLKPLYAGLFMDWDLPGSATDNVACYDSVQRVAYCYDPATTQVVAGVQLLSAQPIGVYSIDNRAAFGSLICFADGFSRAEKYLALSGGNTNATWSAGPSDVSQVVSARLAKLAPGDSATVVFAVLAAPTVAALQAAATDATVYYQQQLLAADHTLGWQLYPIPAHDYVQVVLPADFGPTQAILFSELGQPVRQLALPMSGQLPLQGLAPGVYMLRLSNSSTTLHRRLLVQ